MAKKVIVCVDDEKMVLNSLSKQLERELGDRCYLEIAESAEEAEDLINDLKANGDEVAMVISDQIMPGRKGDELLVGLHQKNAQIVKILLSGQSPKEAAQNAIKNANLYRFIEKPWNEAELVSIVRNGLAQYEVGES